MADTDTDYSETPYARQAREAKAIELEDICFRGGVTSDELADPDVRKAQLAVLSGQRGKSTSASLKTWRLVWTMLRDRERSAMRVSA